jgi:hypothetical protein
MADGVDARSETPAAPAVPLGEQASPLVLVEQTIVDGRRWWHAGARVEVLTLAE